MTSMTTLIASPGAIEAARWISRIFGWIYFASWSLSFYPQPLKNLSRNTTTGTTADFPTANILGFFCLTLSNGLLYYSPTIRAQYAARHPLAPEPTVRGNDVAFAVHALCICAVTASQYAVPRWWGFDVQEKGEGKRVSRLVRGVCGGGVLMILLASGWVVVSHGRGGVEWLDIIYALGLLKLLLTLLKYYPQVLLNHHRRSTAGWSISQILLDFLGGVLSLAQLGIDAALSGDWKEGVVGNPVKWGLGAVSLGYDVVFIAQEFWLYRGKGAEGGLDGEDREGEARKDTEDGQDREGYRENEHENENENETTRLLTHG